MGPESVALEFIPQETVDFLTSTPMLATGIATLIGIGILYMAKGGRIRLKGSGKGQRKPSGKKGQDHLPPSQRPGYSGPAPSPKPALK